MIIILIAFIMPKFKLKDMIFTQKISHGNKVYDMKLKYDLKVHILVNLINITLPFFEVTS